MTIKADGKTTLDTCYVHQSYPRITTDSFTLNLSETKKIRISVDQEYSGEGGGEFIIEDPDDGATFQFTRGEIEHFIEFVRMCEQKLY